MVVSVDPKRVYVSEPEPAASSGKTVVKLRNSEGPNGEKFCWWQVTVKGGREARDLDAVCLAKVWSTFWVRFGLVIIISIKISEELGAGEIMLNCIDMDGQGKGFDLDLIAAVQAAVTIPVIASSGAGCKEHFAEVFENTGVMAALAAGMFHRSEVSIAEVKTHLLDCRIPVRLL